MTRLVLIAALLAALVWTVLSALTQVQPGERAVVRRFGRILDEKPGPGLFVGLPWGLDQVDRIPIARVKRVTVGALGKEDEENETGQLLTGDHNLVNVQAEIYYTVVEKQVEKFVLAADRTDALVARAGETALAEWIAGRTVDEVLLRGKTELPLFLVAEVQSRLADYDLGIHIEQAGISQLYPPKEVRGAFELVAQAQTGIETQVNQAHQDAENKRNEAEAKAFRMTSQAAAYARDQVFQAQGDADYFLKRLKTYRELAAANPTYLNTLWRDEMTRIYSAMQAAGRIDVLDHYLSSEGLNITQFPLGGKKK